MEFNKILGYSDYIRYGLKFMGGLSFSIAVYIALIFMINNGVRIFSEKIKNQEELDKIVLEEAAKLGIEKKIVAILYPSQIGRVDKNKEGEYGLKVGGDVASRLIVKHELYHVFRRDCEQTNSELSNLLIREPRAIVYSILGIKI